MPLVESLALLTTTPFRSSLVTTNALPLFFQLIKSFMVESPPLDRNLLTIPFLVVNLLVLLLLLLGAVRAAASWVLLSGPCLDCLWALCGLTTKGLTLWSSA